MAYGSVKVDNIIFDNGGTDKLITVSGLFYSTSGALTVTGAISGGSVTAPTATFTTLTGTTTAGTTATFTSGSFTSLTGVTTTGTTANFVTHNGASGIFTSLVSGATITGTTANFTSGNFISLSGTTTTVTSGVFSAGSATAPSVAVGTGTSNSPGIYSPGTDQLAISTSGQGRVYVDASGNMGVGVTPSNWNQGTNIDIGAASCIGNNSNLTQISNNRVLTSGVNYYKITAAASLYSTGAGQHVWYNAPSGTAGTAISFTQAMTLDASGRLGLGTIGPTSRISVAGGTTQAADFTITGNNNASGTGIVANFSAGGAGDPATTKGSYINCGASSVGNVYFGLDSSYPGIIRIKTDYPGVRDLLTIDPIGSIVFLPAGSEKMRITSGGLVGIGTTGPDSKLHVLDASGNSLRIGYGSNFNIYDAATHSFRPNGGASEYMRIDSSGRLLVGTSSSRSVATQQSILQIEGTSFGTTNLSICKNSNDIYGAYVHIGKSRGTTVGSSTIVASGDDLGGLVFGGANGSTVDSQGAYILCQVDGTPGASSMPGRLVFSTTPSGSASPTEALRITSAQNIRIGTTGDGSGSTTGRIRLTGNTGGINSVYTEQSVSGGYNFVSSTVSNGGTYYHVNFLEGGTQRGSITSNGVATVYSTSSDYRLKENVTPVFDGIARFKQLKPSRFNFISHPDRTVDGFLAHEAQAVVPECVIGTKDAVDDDGNPIYQGIDQSKLVPLLTAALQEAIAKIETLEARLSALEAA
jgi:hypothetical protein